MNPVIMEMRMCQKSSTISYAIVFCQPRPVFIEKLRNGENAVVLICDRPEASAPDRDNLIFRVGATFFV